MWDEPGWRVGYEKPTGQYPGRAASGLLFVWSFLWPHIKLILLHTFYYTPLNPEVRRNGNYWFAFFGKWSLADVLVMACVLALFNIDVKGSIDEFWHHVEDHFTRLCDEVWAPTRRHSIPARPFCVRCPHTSARVA